MHLFSLQSFSMDMDIVWACRCMVPCDGFPPSTTTNPNPTLLTRYPLDAPPSTVICDDDVNLKLTTTPNGTAVVPSSAKPNPNVFCIHPHWIQCLAGNMCRDCGLVLAPGDSSTTPPAILAMASLWIIPSSGDPQTASRRWKRAADARPSRGG